MPRQAPAIELAFDLANPRAQAFLESHALDLCSTIELGLKDDAVKAIAEGFKQGESVYKIRRRLTDTISNYSKVNAQRVARTEAINASRRGTVEAYTQSGVVRAVRWLASPDSCEICDGMDGREYGLGEVPDSPHPNCILPNVRVESPLTISGSRAFYDGKAIEIITENGHWLTVTPNHMILTPGGFVRAKLLSEGNYIIASTNSQGIVSSVDPYNDNSPAPIEDVWNSLMMQHGMVSMSMPVSPEDFYGDAGGFNGNIDIIYPNSFLLAGISNAFNIKHFDKLSLHSGNAESPQFSRFGSLFLFGNGVMPTPSSIMGSISKPVSFARRKSGHTNNVGLAAIAGRDTRLDELTADYTATDPQGSGQSQFGFTSKITADEIGKGGLGILARRNIVSVEEPVQSIGAYIPLALQFLCRFSSLVTADKVIRISYFNFSGHVYDLQSLLQLYIANNIVVKNCRCAVIAIL